ncbi:MAG: GNAT family N-acetyltransferase [Microcystaceae cyanobacterium]
MTNIDLDTLKSQYPRKFVSEEQIFRQIHRGDRIFIGTACGEPQYLVKSLVNYVESHPKALIDTEIFHVWTLGLAPYTDVKFQRNFRHNSFFIGDHTREAINEGLADYTPIFLSQVPHLFKKGLVPLQVALIQTSLPDHHGYMSLGISLDIVKAAIESASLVVTQMNAAMPRVHGDSFIHLNEVDYILHHDEPLLNYDKTTDCQISQRIGKYVARLVEDGDTIQVGYGTVPNAVLSNLKDKKHLGVHTELISDGIVELLKLGVIDNSHKTLNPHKTIGTFCMGSAETYQYLDDNPAIEFKTVDYTNSPLIIAQNDNMVAINSAIAIDLTGQSTAESIGRVFYSGIGGQADFMRGAVLSRHGRTILTLESTAENGKVSRIVPLLPQGTGVTLNRGDIHYVVTEYGIAYLQGKNIRERAMALIAIAHPQFRPWLIEQAKKENLIYADQEFIAGQEGEYPEALEVYRKTSTGLQLLIRPAKISDESLLKAFFYSLSDESLYRRFMSVRKDIPHQQLQKLSIIDFTQDMVLLAIIEEEEKETILGVGQYGIEEESHTAEIAFAVRDDYQNQGIATALLSYLTYLGKKAGLLGFTAEVLFENRAMIHVFEKMGFAIQRRMSEGVYELKMTFTQS